MVSYTLGRKVIERRGATCLLCCRAHTAGQVSCVRRPVPLRCCCYRNDRAKAGDDWHWNVGDEDAAEAAARREKENELASVPEADLLVTCCRSE